MNNEKEEKQKILKARQLIGGDYFIIIIIISLITYYIENFLNATGIINHTFKTTLNLILRFILPFVGSLFVKTFHFKKLKKYITVDNYKKIKTWLIIEFSLLGLLIFVRPDLNWLAIPLLISYILSIIYLMHKIDNLYKEIKNNTIFDEKI